MASQIHVRAASSFVLLLLIVGCNTAVLAAFINEEHITTTCRYGANSVNRGNFHLPPGTTRKNLEMKKTKPRRALLQSDDICYTLNAALCSECVEKARSKVWRDCLAFTGGRGSAYVPAICSVSI
ncbi:uncharacterized protein A4U43_C08F2200 [Asparagus officinalis]|nr:uncharacterized protein A4U43_C08F2200 [Asparagus officinalis]